MHRRKGVELMTLLLASVLALAMQHPLVASPAHPGDLLVIDADAGTGFDGAAFSACSSPTSAVNLQGGAHTFQVRAVDTTGNADPTSATLSWYVSGNHFK